MLADRRFQQGYMVFKQHLHRTLPWKNILARLHRRRSHPNALMAPLCVSITAQSIAVLPFLSLTKTSAPSSLNVLILCTCPADAAKCIDVLPSKAFADKSAPNSF